jgi:hypothetical protein
MKKRYLLTRLSPSLERLIKEHTLTVETLLEEEDIVITILYNKNNTTLDTLLGSTKVLPILSLANLS